MLNINENLEHFNKLLVEKQAEYIENYSASKQANDKTPALVELRETVKNIASVLKNFDDVLKRSIIQEMQETGVYSAETNNYKVSLRKTPEAIEFDNENDFIQENPDFIKIEKPKIDKTKIRDALKFKSIAGVHLVEGAPTISVRGLSK